MFSLFSEMGVDHLPLTILIVGCAIISSSYASDVRYLKIQLSFPQNKNQTKSNSIQIKIINARYDKEEA